MTTLDSTRLASTGHTLGGLFANITGTIAAWNDARITHKSLSALTARELDDIGLSRGDIDAIAARGIQR
jgi:uncharacterized protein YjiS (DUF1127 family)